jgi:transcriptional regulator with XRE-family HTH domain
MRANVVSPPTASTAFSMGEMCSIPPLLGITYDFRKALPNIFRHCLILGMGNTGHMGAKLKQEAERLGLKPAQVADKFGVKPPSVYDWYEHGRIHKKHYPTLVELSGKPLSWWLDFPEENTRVAKESAAYVGEDPRHKVLLQLFEGLPNKEQDELIRTLTEKKQHYDSVIEELLNRRNAA